MNGDKRFGFLLLIFLMPFVLGPVQAGDVKHTRVRIDYESKSGWMGLRDVNGDGRTDLLIQKNHRIVAYLQLEDRTFDILQPANRRVVNIPETVYLFDFISLPRKHKGGPANQSLSLIGLTPDRVILNSFRKPSGESDDTDSSSVERTFEVASVFQGPRSGAATHARIVRYMDGDSKPEVVIPNRRGYSIYTLSSGGPVGPGVNIRFTPIRLGELFQPYVNRKIKREILYPEFWTGSFLGLNSRHLATFNQRRLLLYPLPDREGREEAREPSEPKPLVMKKEMIGKRKEEFFQYRIPPMLNDLNGDGIRDVTLSDPSDGKMFLFHGGSRKKLKKPKQILNFSGWLVDNTFYPLRKAGTPDLVLLRMEEVGIWNALTLLSSYSARFYLLVLQNKGDGTFKKEPAFEFTVDTSVFLGTTGLEMKVKTPFFYKIGRNMIGSDSNPDLLINRADSVELYKGTPEGTFEDEPSHTLETVDTTGYAETRAVVRDVTGNGRTDIMLKNTGFSGERHLLQIFLLEASSD